MKDGGDATDYLYDAGGQRVVKRGKYGEVATVNAFYTARNANVFTKHVFVGETRIASQVVKTGGGGAGPGAVGGVASTGPGAVVASLGNAPVGDPGTGDPLPPTASGPGNSGNGNANGQANGQTNGNASPGNPNGNANGNANGNGGGSASPSGGSSNAGNPSHGGGDPWTGPHGEGRETGITHGNGKKLGLYKQLGTPPPLPPPPPGNGGNSGGPGTGTGGSGSQEKRIFFYHPDHLGSTSYLTDPTGRVFERLAYFPFGEVWVEEGQEPGAELEFKFTGKELDPETSLHYYGVRYYDASAQVFMSPDPIVSALTFAMTDEDFGRAGPYRMARNNPLKFVDPDGRADKFYELSGGYSARLDVAADPTTGLGRHWELLNSKKETIGRFTPENLDPIEGTHGRTQSYADTFTESDRAALGELVQKESSALRKHGVSSRLRDIFRKEAPKFDSTGKVLTPEKMYPSGKGLKNFLRGANIKTVPKVLGPIMLIPGLLNDSDIMLRGNDAGRSFHDQLEMELREKPRYIFTPGGLIRNPYYDPGPFGEEALLQRKENSSTVASCVARPFEDQDDVGP